MPIGPDSAERELMQQLYNRVRDHLLRQLERARVYDEESGGHRCVYRSPDGLKCAVGCLIPDELYDPAIEGVLIQYGDYEMRPVERKLFKLLGDPPDAVVRLLRDLQSTHDGVDVGLWKEKLREIAVNRDLEP